MERVGLPLLAAVLLIMTAAQARPADLPSRSKAAPRSPPAQPFKVTGWFSYGAAGRTDTWLPASNFAGIVPDLREDVVFGNVAEEIIVIGERARREFADVKPDDALTGPRALDAAQPVVPWIGTACSYKTLCYNMKQPPLRAMLEKLLSN